MFLAQEIPTNCALSGDPMINGKLTAPWGEQPMMRPLRLAAGDADPATRALYQQVLPLLGHELVAVAVTGPETVKLVLNCQPDLLLLDADLPGLDGTAVAEEICRQRPVPSVLLSSTDDPALVALAAERHVYAFLVKPIRQRDLGPAIALAFRHFERHQALARAAEELRQSLEERKLIERAKGVVSKRLGLNEDEGYRRLRRMASHRKQKLVEVARVVMAAEETFTSLDESMQRAGRTTAYPPDREMAGRAR
jgi:two-component system, response regulator PdtaR